jgi:hypothetical protein
MAVGSHDHDWLILGVQGEAFGAEHRLLRDASRDITLRHNSNT